MWRHTHSTATPADDHYPACRTGIVLTLYEHFTGPANANNLDEASKSCVVLVDSGVTEGIAGTGGYPGHVHTGRHGQAGIHLSCSPVAQIAWGLEAASSAWQVPGWCVITIWVADIFRVRR